MFEPNTSSLATFLVDALPIKEIMMKTTMLIVVAALSRVDNEISGRNNWNQMANNKYIDYEAHDFAMGFERRLLLLTTNNLIINLPKDLLDGTTLKKLVNAGLTFKS